MSSTTHPTPFPTRAYLMDDKDGMVRAGGDPSTGAQALAGVFNWTGTVELHTPSLGCSYESGMGGVQGQTER